MGNNEMVGPFGAATVFGAKAPPLGFVRLNLAIQKTRVGQLLVDKVTDTWVAGRDKCLSKFTRQKEGQNMAETDNLPLSPKPARA